MKHLVAQTTGEAWLLAAEEVMKHGNAVKDGNLDLKEALNVFLTVEHPLESDEILAQHADPLMLEWMRRNFFQVEPIPHWGYSYGQRLFSYQGIDQIAEIVAKLKQNPDSKSATVSLMNPAGDREHTPCIVALDFKRRAGALITTAYFRSQDAGKKIYADLICLGEVGRLVAKAIGAREGALNVLIVSLHAYQADWDKIQDMISCERYELLPTYHV